MSTSRGKRPIGLITDFGDGPYQGIMKAVIASIDPNVKVIDLDHWVPSYSITAGAYIVANSFFWMPKGSVIAVVVDPGVGFGRNPIVVETENYIFVGPDNGVLYPAIVRDGFKSAYIIEYSRIKNLVPVKFRGQLRSGEWQISNTFHGRDVFAPAAALIASGTISPSDLGDPVGLEKLKKLSIEHLEVVNGYYRASVVYIDKFGNVALSVKPNMLPIRKWRSVSIKTPAGMFRARVAETFSEVPANELLIYVNSFGFIEVAVNRGNAAQRLGLEVDMKVSIIPMEWERGEEARGEEESARESYAF